MKPWGAALALVVAGAAVAPAGAGAAAPVVTGLDHVIVAVEDLEGAAALYRALGFALKPGRPHANGIRNEHVKFPDGSEIELLTAAAARDELTATYRRHLEDGGDGPAFAVLYAPERAALLARLRSAGTAPREGGLVTLGADPALRSLAFGGRNASPTDLPEHFAHANGASTLAGVWLAPDDPAALAALLRSLGAAVAEEPLAALGPGVTATVARLPEGFVALLDRSRRRHPGRPVVGATVLVRDLAETLRVVGPGVASPLPAGGRGLVIPPERAAGLVLELREEPPRVALDEAAFGPRAACFLVREVASGRALVEHGGERCRAPSRACSTLKVPLAAVAFAAGLFASPETVIPWDGRPQRRAVVAADLTPRSYLELSANWVSERIVDRLGPDRVTAGLRALLPVSPPVTVTRPAEGDTVEGPVELTPEDQVAFWRRLWTGSLALPAAAREALLASLPRHRAGDLTVFGKTGTCCVDPGCESGPGRQLGWYVGVAEQGDLAYAFALRFTDLAPSRGYAGATARELVAALLPAVLTPLPAGNIGPGDGLSPDAPGPGAVN